MSATGQILNLLISTASHIFILLLWMRYLLQLVQADFYNPVSQGVVRFTDPVLKPLRSAMPKSRFHDWSALLVILLLQLLTTTLLALVTAGATLPPLGLLFKTVFDLLFMVTDFFFWLIIVSVVLSWISPGHSPVTGLIQQLAEPVLAPFRRLLPSMGGMDLSPILAFLAIQVIQILLGAAAGSLHGMF